MKDDEKTKSLKKIGEETLDICKDGGYKYPDGSWKDIFSSKTSVVYEEDVFQGNVKVVQQTTLKALSQYENAVALNFASGSHPGGGFLWGAPAQEESLCRASNLYPMLESCENFYQANNDVCSSLFTDTMIYSPEVVFFRDDDGNLLKTPFKNAIITAAAPNYNNLLESEKQDVPRIFYRRLKRIFEIARDHSHDTIILGAWGCGAYGNDPALVAVVTEQCLKQYRYSFNNIVLAITNASMCDIFRDHLGIETHLDSLLG